MARFKMYEPYFRVLVVCKNVLMDQWRTEIQKWTKLKVLNLPFDVKERV